MWAWVTSGRFFKLTGLELEITEGLLMDRSEAVTATLAALKAMGLIVSIDDFGTGYSSLSYLRQSDSSLPRSLSVILNGRRVLPHAKCRGLRLPVAE